MSRAPFPYRVIRWEH